MYIHTCIYKFRFHSPPSESSPSTYGTYVANRSACSERSDRCLPRHFVRQETRRATHHSLGAFEKIRRKAKSREERKVILQRAARWHGAKR